ncbi:hypothetical protein [Burkholderia sp. BCC1972]|uniref:hypothetical protein n=1 Tax=Burkholderia sp. BCC1972 TaxID=2817438 RepID=UPI002ABD5A71|nr:hypothetical protein [Burkholderia sp. BCC1972]
MTENQSVIDKNEMNNCGGKSLKFFADWPLTSGCQGWRDCGDCRIGETADIHWFIHDPQNRFY